MSAWGNDTSAEMAVANNAHRGSCKVITGFGRACRGFPLTIRAITFVGSDYISIVLKF